MFGDQVAFEALVRMTDEEIKHQELFRRLEEMMAADMPAGYVMTADPNAVARAVLGKSNWAVLALTLDIELFTQAHYRASIEPTPNCRRCGRTCSCSTGARSRSTPSSTSWSSSRENARIGNAERDAAVDDLIELVGAVDGILQAQAEADARYFVDIASGSYSDAQVERIHAVVLKAYRWQYIVSGVSEPRFQKVLFPMLDEAQASRIQNALAPLSYAVPTPPEMVVMPIAA